MRGASTAFRFALRELRGGLKGFGVFIACIILGVAAIAAVGSVSRALVTGLLSDGGLILGGDLSASVIHREAGPEEMDLLTGLGRVSAIATVRGMARNEAGDAQTLVEIKAVDGAYPLYGSLELEPGAIDPGLAPSGGTYGVYAEAGLTDRLGIGVGDPVLVGNIRLQLRGIIDREPDRLAGGIGFGPRLMMSREALSASGLIQPGSLVRYHYRVALTGEASDAAVAAAKTELDGKLADQGYRVTSRSDAAPGLRSQIELFSQFLTLVGLTALMVGGVGIANAVRSHLDGRLRTIATLKALGASNGFVTQVYLYQIGIIALGAIVIGAAIGALAPLGAQSLAEALLPIPVRSEGLYPAELAMAGLFSLLAALGFTLWPLGRVHNIPVSAIYRDRVAPMANRPPLRFIVASAAVALILGALVLTVSEDKRVALIFMGSLAASFVLLQLIGRLVMMAARRAATPRSAIARLALANIHRPGALTASIVLSLGLGLTLLVTLALIDSNISRQLTTSLPERAPSFFFIDVPREEVGDLTTLIGKEAPQGKVEEVPMLRGRFVSLAGRNPEDVQASPDAQWALRGDRGITYSKVLPENSRLVEGQWWPENYDGPPLVSFEDEIARGLGLKIGDKVTVNVLGREIEATIANLRSVEWTSLGINFVMVFSPNTFAGAPHMMLATVTLPGNAGIAEEAALARAVAQQFPTITSVRVKEALDAVNSLVGKLAWAVRAASAVALIAAVLVLAGALAASHSHRIADAVILKMLGARRGQLVQAYLLEFLAIGVATALFAVLAGSVIAWGVLTHVMHVEFAPNWVLSGVSVAVALAVTIAIGLFGTRRALAGKPASVLRNL
ncbi:MAG: ABC transporter permease [Rhodobiaceae bacterium]|nr:ABC transporter permease [Rhodobiaceae bacterium]MCC0055526.1 ABC transporter permease [Rhodobiaceae bacterium]